MSLDNEGFQEQVDSRIVALAASGRTGASSDVTGTVTNSWTYDLNGNRLTEAKTGNATVYYAYNAADQLCWYASTTGTCAAPPTGATTYTYDANGNTTAAGTTGTQAYNTFDQFTSNTSGSTVTNYTYAGQSNTAGLNGLGKE
jgi:hypothetical protein